jgi:YVTN family beta-propeller protein
MRRNLTRHRASSPLARVIVAGAAVAMVASGCASANANGSSPAGGAPTFGPVPATPAPAQPKTSPLPAGVLASIPVDSAGGIGFGFGSVWTGSHRSNVLTRIGPATGKVTATIDTGMVSSCGTVGIGFGRVWVSGCNDDPQTVVVDPSTNQVVGRIPHTGLSVGFGAGSAWIGSLASIGGGGDPWAYRINPKTLAVQARFKVPGSGMAFGAGSAWVADEANGTVARIDPATNKVIAVIPAGLPGADGTVAVFAAGYLWIYPGFFNPPATDKHDNKIWRINPHGNSVTQKILPSLAHLRPAFTTGYLTTGMGSLWIRGYHTAVYQYDPRTLRLIGAYPADTAAIGMMAPGFGSLWVTNMDTSTLWRDRLAS